MPRQKSKRRSKARRKRSKSRRRGTKKGQRRKTARRAYKGLKKKKSKSSRSLKQLKTRAKRSRQKSRGDQGRCEYGVAPNNECLTDMGKLQGGVRSKYRYNKSPLEGKVLNVKTMDNGQQLVYANLNPRQSIVIPVDPHELEQFFGSSKEATAERAKLTSQKRNLRVKYNELEKVAKKLEHVNKEKAKKKEPVSPNCEMLLSMVASNLKLAKDKLSELETHCKELEKVHNGLKMREEVSKKVALDYRAKIRQLTKARKDASVILSSSNRKKAHVKKLLDDVVKMSIKVSQMCKHPSVPDVGDVPDVGGAADQDAQQAADKGKVTAEVPADVLSAKDMLSNNKKNQRDKLEKLVDAPDKILDEQEIEEDTWLKFLDKKFGINDDLDDHLENLDNVTPVVIKKIDALETVVQNLINNLTVLDKWENSPEGENAQNFVDEGLKQISRAQDKVYDKVMDETWHNSVSNLEKLSQKQSLPFLIKYKLEVYRNALETAKQSG